MHPAILSTSRTHSHVITETCAIGGSLLRFLPQIPRHRLRRLHKLLKDQESFLFSFREDVPPLEVTGRFTGLDASGNWLIRVDKVVSTP